MQVWQSSLVLFASVAFSAVHGYRPNGGELEQGGQKSFEVLKSGHLARASKHEKAPNSVKPKATSSGGSASHPAKQISTPKRNTDPSPAEIIVKGKPANHIASISAHTKQAATTKPSRTDEEERKVGGELKSDSPAPTRQQATSSGDPASNSAKHTSTGKGAVEPSSAEKITTGDESPALTHQQVKRATVDAKHQHQLNAHAVKLHLEHDLEAQDVDKWSDDLKKIGVLLKDAHPHGLDINTPPGAFSALAGERLGRGAGGADSLSFLGRAAGLGWLPGVQALVEWDKGRTDSAQRLRLDDGGTDNTTGKSISPLTLAAENSHASVVRYLLQQRASFMLRDQTGRTPLELAAAAGDADVIEALLVRGSGLAYGLAPLRMEFIKDAQQLPKMDKRWPFGDSRDGVMDAMRKKASDFGIAPSESDKLDVGELPVDWIVLYKNRVMHALSTVASQGSESAVQAEVLLATHMYDAFARDFSVSVILLSIALGIFGLFVYMIFRIRLFGGPEVPVCLAHMVPGSFDPVRLADPDFDPSRQSSCFPYKASSAALARTTPAINAAAAAFLKALAGVFSSWLFMSVRIPPVKDSFDEDFLSDDDDNSRKKVCDQCAERARLAHKFEVVVRATCLIVLLWWLCWQSRRWCEASIVVFMFLQSSLIAASVAASTGPVGAEKALVDENTQEDAGDAARMICALFGVQHGPRWARSISTTRSTAAPSKSRLARRQRPKRVGKPRNELADGVEESHTPDEQLTSNSRQDTSTVAEGIDDEKVPFFECWQRCFVQSGSMHIEHSAFLQMTVVNMTLIGLMLLWLTHIRFLASGSFGSFYAPVLPTELPQIYGMPGSGKRGFAILLEIALLVLAGERLFSIAGLLQTAALSLQQRHRSLRFAIEHPPPPVVYKAGSDQAILVKDASYRLEESIRCAEFASELSSLRWNILRNPVLIVFTMALILMAFASLPMVLMVIEATSDAAFPRFHDSVMHIFHTWSVDPMVPLGVALCLIWPMMLMLVAAAVSNAEVFELRGSLRQDVASALAEMPADPQADVQYVALRNKAEEALCEHMICWPGGRELTLFEPAILLLSAALACGLAVVTGRALPGTGM